MGRPFTVPCASLLGQDGTCCIDGTCMGRVSCADNGMQWDAFFYKFFLNCAAYCTAFPIGILSLLVVLVHA